MNIDQLTYGEIKELVSLFGEKKSTSTLLESSIGKYVIVRSKLKCKKI